MNLRILLLAATGLLLGGPATAEVYKCRDANGQIEIANIPCPSGSNTVKTVRDEPVSEANRRQAEREVERMQEYVEKREAAQRADQAAEREVRKNSPSAAASNAPNAQNIDDCLRELEQKALPPGQRAQMESACRSGQPGNQPQYVPVPVAVYPGTYQGNPLGNCIQNVQRLTLLPAERSRRISQCEASYGNPPPPPHPHKPAPAKPAPRISCPTGSNCLQR